MGQSCSCAALKIRCRSRRTSSSQARQSMASQAGSTSSGPFTVTASTVVSVSMASNLPFGSGGSDRIASKAHLPTSAPFRVRAAARYPAGYTGQPAEGLDSLSRFPVALRRTGIRFLGILFPPGTWAFVTSGLPARLTALPDPDGVSTFRMRELRPGWAPPRPRGQRCSHGRRRSARPPLAVPPRLGPAPWSSSHLPGLWVTRHQRGFTHVRPSGLPLACAPGWNGTRFGFFPELRTPQLPATHVRAGTGLEHWPGAMPPTSSALQSASSLTTCDLVSHVLGPVIAHEKPQRPSLSRSAVTVSSLRGNYRRPNDTVLTPSPAGTTSQQRSTLPASRQGHDLSSGLRELPGDGQCSPAGGYRPESAATAAR